MKQLTVNQQNQKKKWHNKNKIQNIYFKNNNRYIRLKQF